MFYHVLSLEKTGSWVVAECRREGAVLEGFTSPKSVRNILLNAHQKTFGPFVQSYVTSGS